MILDANAKLSVQVFQSTHSITECDTTAGDQEFTRSVFQSTHSITECDWTTSTTGGGGTISIHALHYRVRLQADAKLAREVGISIHALHYRVRFKEVNKCYKIGGISIHALHYRVRFLAKYPDSVDTGIFQSTHSITECDLDCL